MLNTLLNNNLFFAFVERGSLISEYAVVPTKVQYYSSSSISDISLYPPLLLCATKKDKGVKGKKKKKRKKKSSFFLFPALLSKGREEK